MWIYSFLYFDVCKQAGKTVLSLNWLRIKKFNLNSFIKNNNLKRMAIEQRLKVLLNQLAIKQFTLYLTKKNKCRSFVVVVLSIFVKNICCNIHASKLAQLSSYWLKAIYRFARRFSLFSKLRDIHVGGVENTPIIYIFHISTMTSILNAHYII
jgi:hypothetical protein